MARGATATLCKFKNIIIVAKKTQAKLQNLLGNM